MATTPMFDNTQSWCSCGKEVLTHSEDRRLNWSSCRERSDSISQYHKMHIPFDQAIPLPGISLTDITDMHAK